jgi:hypothetical protein
VADALLVIASINTAAIAKEIKFIAARSPHLKELSPGFHMKPIMVRVASKFAASARLIGA